MVFGYQLGVYVGLVGLLIAAGVCIWKGYVAVRTLATLLLSVYLSVLLAVELLPFSLEPTAMLSYDLGIWPVPFELIVKSLMNFDTSVVPTVGSLAKMGACFIPFGLLLPLAEPRCRKFRNFAALLATVACAFELVQLIEGALVGVAYRRVSFDEAFLAAIGGFAGYAVWYLLSKGACALKSRGAMSK